MRRIVRAIVVTAVLAILAVGPVAAATETYDFTLNDAQYYVFHFDTSQTGRVVADVVLREGSGTTMTLTGPTVCEARRCDKHHAPTTYTCTVTVTEVTFPYTGRGCGWLYGPAGAWTVRISGLGGFVGGWVDYEADYLVEP